ncbi:MAG: efflux RND transporter permease subunit, partial [Methylocystis sp.]|uniref:efflux RND transporter permease subunit n=1 Tax=Methylocystis sp. TaxID=1911079 RepID=UPI003D10E624
MKPQDGQKSFVGVFIERPILALVLSLLIVIAGLAALMGVEVRELPEVDQPVVSVQTRYPGATPESIDSEVTAIIESAISQVNGVESISARSEFGASRVIVEFSTKADIDVAATDIKNAVAAVQRNLPEGAEEPVVVKADADGQPIVRIAVSAEKMSEDEIGYLVDKIIVPRLQSIEGVAVAEAYGVRNRVIRVRLNPVELAARGVSVDDIAALVRRSTVSAPSGSLRSDRQELLIRAEAPVTSPEEIGALRLNDETRLSDLAVVEWGLQRETTRMRQDGTRSVGIGIVRQAQSNTIAIANGVHAAIKELKPSLPAGVDIRVNVDDSIFIKRAIEEVLISLVLAIGIVLLVIFMFLRSASATLIPATAIPISLIGTVAAIWLCGFSINILTLLALVMATGLVVDDAIVVTENVQRWRAKGYGKRAAAYLGAREIVFAILSTTATLAAVFIPISFLPGQAGRLFSEFGFVVAFAVIISSFVALTLCPMLTVKFGSKNIPGSSANSSAFAPMSAIGRVGAGLYEKGLSLALRAPFVFFGAACLFAAGAVVAFSLIPRELTPVEDRGRVWVNVNVQESANFEYL